VKQLRRVSVNCSSLLFSHNFYIRKYLLNRLVEKIQKRKYYIVLTKYKRCLNVNELIAFQLWKLFRFLFTYLVVWLDSEMILLPCDINQVACHRSQMIRVADCQEKVQVCWTCSQTLLNICHLWNKELPRLSS
jgi:hypothetical protein